MAEINQNATAGNEALSKVLEGILTDLTMLRIAMGAATLGSTVVDLPALSDGAGTTTTLTVTGAILGDYALVSSSLDLSGLTVNGYISAADTVSVRVQNESGATVDISSITLRARVIPRGSLNALVTTT